MKKATMMCAAVLLLWGSLLSSAEAQAKSVAEKFSRIYSYTLISGTYLDHASIFSNPVYYERKKYNAAGIRAVARKFYSNFETIDHKFDIWDAYLDKDGLITVIAYETHVVRNRKTRKTTTGGGTCLIRLIMVPDGWACYSKEAVTLE